jgi:hypothetical protein
VTNAPPTVDPITGPASGVRGQTLSFSSQFTDVGALDTHQATWNFGDGTGDVGPASASPGTFTSSRTPPCWTTAAPTC